MIGRRLPLRSMTFGLLGPRTDPIVRPYEILANENRIIAICDTSYHFSIDI